MPPQPRPSQPEAPAGAIASPESKHTPQRSSKSKSFCCRKNRQIGNHSRYKDKSRCSSLIFCSCSYKYYFGRNMWLQANGKDSWEDYIAQMKGGERDVIDWITAKMDQK